MSKVYGIDLGTTYSVIATLDDSGSPYVIENTMDASPLLASAIYFPPEGDPVVGREAKNQAEAEPARVAERIKREIGRDDARKFEFNGQEYNPIMLSSIILKRLKAYAEEQGHTVSDVVITCPAEFTASQRMATKQAGEIAGLNVLNIVNEPTAAALNYCYREFQENRKILVYDLGGGTFDITLFNFAVDENNQASIEVLETSGNDQLGGVDWDGRLYELLVERYAEAAGCDTEEVKNDANLIFMILSKVEDTKKSLSSMDTRNFTITYDGSTTRVSVNRQDFEDRTRDLVIKTTDFIDHLLATAGIAKDEIDLVLLVGGSTRMPMVKNAIEELFPGKTRIEDPDLAIAKGAAIVAAMSSLTEEVRRTSSGGELGTEAGETDTAGMLSVFQPMVILEKLGRSLGPAVLVNGADWMIDNLLFVGDDIPAEISKEYGTAADNQPSVVVQVFENTSRDRENSFVTPSIDRDGNEQFTDPILKVKKIGDVRLELPDNTPKGTPIEVFFKSSEVGLEVRATNLRTGDSISAIIESVSLMDAETVESAKTIIQDMTVEGQIL